MSPTQVPASSGRVAVVGTLNVDLVWQVAALPRPGQTILAHTTERQFGGKGANQAVAASRQGAQVTLVGAVGDDAEGRSYREYLTREGIDGSFVSQIPGVATGTAHVYVDARGENLIVVDQGANARIDAQRLPALLPKVDIVLVQLECALAPAVEALQATAAARVRSVLNASPVNPAFPWGKVALHAAIVNEHECAECFGASPGDLLAASDAVRRELLARYGVEHLVVTQGAEPTLHFSADGCEQVSTYAVQPRDTVGAGDMFAGTLAARLAEGWAWRDALWHANVAAALSTLALGAQAAMPTRVVVEAVIEAYSATQPRRAV